MLSMLLFAALFSLDTLFAGIACGLRNVRFPMAAGAYLGLISAVFLTTGGLLGARLGAALPGRIGQWSGGMILIALGLWILWSAHKDGSSESLTGDRDHSGDLSLRELALLGAGLGSDGFTGAAALALSGTNYNDIVILAILLAAATGAAFYLGHRLANMVRPTRSRWTLSAPGCLFIIAGLLRLNL